MTTTYTGSTSIQHYTLRFVLDFTQNISGNYSDVTWNLYLDKPAGNSDWSTWQSQWSVDIGGNGTGGYVTIDFRQYSTLWMGTGTTRIYHDAAGNPPAGMTVSAAFSESHALIGNASTSGPYNLPAIPRASMATFDHTSIDAGQVLTIYTNRASTAFTHTVKYTFGPQSGTILTGVTDQVQWIPPLSLLTAIPNSTAGGIVITTDTYNGSTLIGTTTNSLTITVPTSVVPTFTTVTNSENNTAVSTTVGQYVQNLSKLNLAITGASGAYGSTISTFQITAAGQTINASSGVTGTIASSGTVPIVGTVTDSRGRTASKTVNITVLAYAGPNIIGYTVQRATSAGVVDANGTYIRIDLNAAVPTLKNGATEKNALTYSISTRLRGATSWTAKSTNVAPGGIAFNSYVLVSPYAVETAWEVLVSVSDKFNTASVQSTVSTAAIFMHWASTGMGLGKFWERGGLDVYGPIYGNNGMQVLDTSFQVMRNLGALATGTDWNTLQSAGTYRTSDIGTNGPTGAYGFGFLEIISGNGGTTQRYTEGGGSRGMYQRVLWATANSWTTWGAHIPNPVVTPTTGALTYGSNYKVAASATWEQFSMTKTGNLVQAKGHIANTGAITFAGSTIYQIGTLPSGFIPAKQTMRPISVTPLSMGAAWVIAYPTGALSMAFQTGATISAADGWVIGFDVTWSIV